MQKEEVGREEEQEPKQYNQNRRKGHDDIGDRELDCVWFMTGTLLTCVRCQGAGLWFIGHLAVCDASQKGDYWSFTAGLVQYVEVRGCNETARQDI